MGRTYVLPIGYTLGIHRTFVLIKLQKKIPSVGNFFCLLLVVYYLAHSHYCFCTGQGVGNLFAGDYVPIFIL